MSSRSSPLPRQRPNLDEVGASTAECKQLLTLPPLKRWKRQRRHVYQVLRSQPVLGAVRSVESHSHTRRFGETTTWTKLLSSNDSIAAYRNSPGRGY